MNATLELLSRLLPLSTIPEVRSFTLPKAADIRSECDLPSRIGSLEFDCGEAMQVATRTGVACRTRKPHSTPHNQTHHTPHHGFNASHGRRARRTMCAVSAAKHALVEALQRADRLPEEIAFILEDMDSGIANSEVLMRHVAQQCTGLLSLGTTAEYSVQDLVGAAGRSGFACSESTDDIPCSDTVCSELGLCGPLCWRTFADAIVSQHNVTCHPLGHATQITLLFVVVQADGGRRRRLFDLRVQHMSPGERRVVGAGFAAYAYAGWREIAAVRADFVTVSEAAKGVETLGTLRKDVLNRPTVARSIPRLLAGEIAPRDWAECACNLPPRVATQPASPWDDGESDDDDSIESTSEYDVGGHGDEREAAEDAEDAGGVRAMAAAIHDPFGEHDYDEQDAESM